MRAMMMETLALQWRAARWALLPFVVVAFGFPLMALRTARGHVQEMPFAPAEAVLVSLQLWLIVFPMTAALLGVAVGLAAWAWDHGSRHVYALSLPLHRWEYALLKFGAGAVLLLIPVAALLAGLLLGLVGFELPDGLHAYPFAFTLRFLMAALVTYAIAFALASATMRTAVWVISAYVAFLIFGTMAVGFARDSLGMTELMTPYELMTHLLMRWPGPFHVLGGNWMPIDV